MCMGVGCVNMACQCVCSVCVGVAINLGQQLFACRNNGKEKEGQSQGGIKVEVGC